MNTLHIVCTVFHRCITLRRLIDGFILQTSQDWVLHIVHDGPAPEGVKAVMALYNDPRIQYEETEKVNGCWGHVNRQMMIKKMVLNHRDYLLITNDDNDYVPEFVNYMIKRTGGGTAGMVYCDTVHSYMNYDILKTQVRENYIDMGSFIVRMDVAKRVGFNHFHESADGTYAERCASFCKHGRMPILYIPKPLFIHC